jgi:hypothetical protein
LTVTWPMPREAPVRIRVLRSSLGICAMALLQAALLPLPVRT